MVEAPETFRMPHKNWWVAALCVAAAATGVGFGVSIPLGVALAVVTVCIMVAVMVLAARFGRRRRREGHTPDLSALRQRLRKHLKWQVLGGVVVIIGLFFPLSRHDNRLPTWLLVAVPVVLVLGVLEVWVAVRYALPWAERRQAERQNKESA